MKRLVTMLTTLLISKLLIAQGSLLLIGGGTEQNTENAWNAQAYKWALDQTENRRVAIIHYDSGSEWLEGYFKDDLGANQAKSWIIGSQADADAQALYDSLVTYDMFFFRGGDQSEYYQLYNGTRTEDAIRHVFGNGGTMAGTSAGMAMLAGIMYTAENGTVYPDECLQNPQSMYITLKDDFLDFFPGYVFDTHVAERGRMFRALGFMANWALDQETAAGAISVDDMTALAIGPEGLATVYGTGAARIFPPQGPGQFALHQGLLTADKLPMHQLLQGWQYNFETGETTANGQTYTPDGLGETGAYTLLISGSAPASDNTAFLEHLVGETGNPEDGLVLVSAVGSAQANTYKAKLESMDATVKGHVEVSLTSASNSEYATLVKDATQFLFVDNNPAELLAFLGAGEAGAALQTAISGEGATCAFVGEDSRLPGKTVVENYTGSGNSYYHEMTTTPGLGLLDKSMVIPGVFRDPEVYENMQTAVPYFMAANQLTFGAWVPQKSFLKYSSESGSTYFSGHGQMPVAVLKNEGGAYNFSEQTSYGYASDEPRMVAGLENTSIYVLAGEQRLKTGETVVNGLERGALPGSPSLEIYPNPSPDYMHVRWGQAGFTLQLFTPGGRLLKTWHTEGNTMRFHVGQFAPGHYLLKCSRGQGPGRCAARRVVIH